MSMVSPEPKGGVVRGEKVVRYNGGHVEARKCAYKIDDLRIHRSARFLLVMRSTFAALRWIGMAQQTMRGRGPSFFPIGMVD